jgi:hypothetical protein
MESEQDKPLNEQNEAFLKRELYNARDLISKLTFVQNALKSMYSTESVESLRILLGASSTVSRLAQEHLECVEVLCAEGKNHE